MLLQMLDDLHLSLENDPIWTKIESIDLTMVKLKLMDAEEGQGWGAEYTNWVEVRYRRYLYMIVISQDGNAVPTKEIDLFWHQHILDTRAYAADCQRVFGEFIHHFPYFGMRGPEDAADLDDSFQTTKTLYREVFGEDYCTGWLSADAASCHKPGESKCHKCSTPAPSCHKCQSQPGPDTIKCTRCKTTK